MKDKPFYKTPRFYRLLIVLIACSILGIMILVGRYVTGTDASVRF